MENKPNDLELQRMMEQFDKAAWALAKEKLHRHIIQILNRDDESPYKYKPGGSGVLVQIKGRYFILTASHVTELSKDIDLFANSQGKIVEITGDFNESDLSINKNIDLAFIELEKNLGELLARSYDFLPVEKIEYGHAPSKKDKYMASGYPERNIRIDEATHSIITGSSHFLLTISEEKRYKFYRLDPKENFLLNFEGGGTDLESGERIRRLDDPYGISGCGLWHLHPFISEGKLLMDYSLVGIMYMVKRDKYQVLIANRIEIVVQGLNDRYGLALRPAFGT